MDLSPPPPSLEVGPDHPGTPESVWRESGLLEATGELALYPWSAAVVVAPHPDDEVLGAGGLLQRLLDARIPTTIVAVTDGEASHPGSPAARDLDLRAIRCAERRSALQRLHPQRLAVRRIGIRDGAVAAQEEALGEELTGLLSPGHLCIAPWPRDGHPDHDAAGRAATRACARSGADSLGYLVWAWHWASPADLPWASCRRLDLPAPHMLRKRSAVQAYRSQLVALGEDQRDGPVLPAGVLGRFWRIQEIFVTGTGQAGEGP